MRSLFALALLASACSAPASPPAAPERDFATQIDVPTPDYAALLALLPVPPRGGTQIEATAPLPANAKAIGDQWIARLQARNVVDGYGLAGKSADGPVIMIDVLMTERDFRAWIAENGWTMPRHISWTFRPEMIFPAVSDAAQPGIRVWPATTRLTGLQHQAALTGRIVLRDGCFYLQGADGSEKLAWFLAETGLAVDDEGLLILINRLNGETKARVGEPVIWSGPNAQPAESELGALRAACGPGAVTEVGNPEAAERFYVQYPHTRPGVPFPQPQPPPG